MEEQAEQGGCSDPVPAIPIPKSVVPGDEINPAVDVEPAVAEEVPVVGPQSHPQSDVLLLTHALLVADRRTEGPRRLEPVPAVHLVSPREISVLQ